MKTLLASLLLTLPVFSQAAAEANRRYQSVEGRQGMLTNLGAADRAFRLQGERIVAASGIKPGMTVAEIGSGWGALGTFLARNYGVKVVSVTLSPEQCAVAKQRALDEGVADRVDFRELDYRLLEGTYDRVVSIAMMEAIGVDEFDTYFRKIKALTKPDGFALVHCIGRASPPGTTAPFIRKYIFPGGYVPALSEVFASLERTGTWCADCETLRLHYYWTIKHWREAFDAKRAESVAMMGERFCRMWDFYLASVELGFLHGSNFVFQLLLSGEAGRRAGGARLHRG